MRFYRHSRAVLPAILLLVAMPVRSEQTPHLERIEEAMAQVAANVFRRGGIPDTICVTTISHPADWIAMTAFLATASEKGRVAVRCTPPYSGEILVAVRRLSVDLVEIDDETLYRREVTVGLALSLPRRDDGTEERYTDNEDVVLRDTIERSSAGDLVTPEYQFTQPRYIASTSTSFWKQIAEPAVVLGTTVAMVVLLFTTRSQ